MAVILDRCSQPGSAGKKEPDLRSDRVSGRVLDDSVERDIVADDDFSHFESPPWILHMNRRSDQFISCVFSGVSPSAGNGLPGTPETIGTRSIRVPVGVPMGERRTHQEGDLSRLVSRCAACVDKLAEILAQHEQRHGDRDADEEGLPVFDGQQRHRDEGQDTRPDQQEVDDAAS
jgi:hypothetical protein